MQEYLYAPIIVMNRQYKVRYKQYNNLDHLPELYDRTHDLEQVMKETWHVLTRSAYALTTDRELAHDFCVDFYEKLDACFQAFNKNKDRPFLPFLIVYVRHAFFNYVRYRRRRQIEEKHFMPETLESAPSAFYHDVLKENSPKEEHSHLLSMLPMHMSLLVKLHLGLELNIHELDFVIQKTGSASKVQSFIAQGRARREKQSKKTQVCRERIAYLNQRIHQSASHIEVQRLSQRKRYAHKTLQQLNTVGEMTRIANLLTVSKSTISRRLRIAARHLEDIMIRAERRNTALAFSEASPGITNEKPRDV